MNSINQRKLGGITRREFLRIAGFTLGGLVTGCATFDTKKDWTQLPAKDFPLKAYESWYKRKKHFNKLNPNLRFKHRNGWHPKYQDMMFSWNGATPGIDYSSGIMVAAAPGRVISTTIINSSKTGRIGGREIHIGHGTGKSMYSVKPEFENWSFFTKYSHLDEYLVKFGDKIERGQPLGIWREYWRSAKLHLPSRQDPDNYGLLDIYDGEERNYMRYLEDHTDKTILNEPTKIEMEKKYKNQFYIVLNLYKDFVFGPEEWHHKHSSSRPYEWSFIEEFRFLKSLYEINPKLFPNIGKDQFDSMKKDFYDNHPTIILTLPLKKS